MAFNLMLVSPKGWGYENKNFLFHEKTFKVTTDFELNCKKCDEVWFMNCSFKIDDNLLILPKIKFAQEKDKIIKYFRSKTAEVRELLSSKENLKQEVPDALGTIYTPIVLVAGLFRHSGGWESELALLDGRFRDEYKVIQICSEPEGELLGMRPFPEFMTNSNYNEAEKIIAFNRYIEEIEKSEKPDLFIIGVPGGIKAYSRDIPEDFGILFTMVSNAVSADSLVLALPYAEYSKAELDEIKRSIWQKYQVYTDCICLSRKMVMPYDSDIAHKLRYMLLEREKISKKIREINDESLYDVEEGKERLQNNIIKKLLEYGEVEFM